MIKCLIVDDEPLALKQLEAYISQVPSLELCGACSSAREAQQKLEEAPADVIFTDINMPDTNGLDFIKNLEQRPIVVFTTAYGEHALDAYRLNALDYLLKPFGLDEFKRVAAKVERQFELVQAAKAGLHDVVMPDEDDSIFLKTDYKLVRIGIRDIMRVEAMSEYLKVFVKGVNRPIIVLMSMKKMEERITPFSFMRVHRSSIINLQKIKEVHRSRVTLDDGTDVPIGDSYREQFLSYLNKHFLTK